MLESYSINDEANGDTNLDSESNRLQRNSNLVGEDFRSLPYTNSRENSKITIGTTRMIMDQRSSGLQGSPNLEIPRKCGVIAEIRF